MIQEIRSELFSLKIPLPGSSLKHLNAYVIRSNQRHLIVDTGLNHPACLEAMRAGLDHLGVDLARSDFFITHLHNDHLGLVKALTGPDSKVYFNRPDAEVMGGWQGWGPLAAFAAGHGFPPVEIAATVEQLPGNDIGARLLPQFTLLEDGDALEAGPYRFICVQTPGHSFGHLCLYEAAHKLLIAGDHLLADISPSLQCWTEERNPLEWYLKSLDRVFDMEIDLVLPGHRRLITDHQARITELKHHHADRCREILAILGDKAMSGFEVASCMHWEIRCDSWDSFPAVQKWFAFGEAMAHLKYLEGKGQVVQNTQNSVAKFRVTSFGVN